MLAAEGWVRMLRIRYSRQERLGHVRTSMPLARAVLEGSPAWHSPMGAQTMQQQFKEVRMAGRHIPARFAADACALGFASQGPQSLCLVLCVRAGRSQRSPSLDKAAIALSTLRV